jgi:hypothetical protein
LIALPVLAQQDQVPPIPKPHASVYPNPRTETEVHRAAPIPVQKAAPSQLDRTVPPAVRQTQAPAPSQFRGHREPTNPDNYGRNTASEGLVDKANNGMRNAVNPSDRDYGQLFSSLQQAIVDNVFTTAVWWGAVVTFILLVLAGGYIVILKDKEEVVRECFVRAAKILIGQRETAYKYAQEAAAKHNDMVERYDTLFVQSRAPEAGQFRPDEQTKALPSAAPVQQPVVQSAPKPTVQEVNMDDAEIEEDFTPAGERVISIKGVRYIEYDQHQRRVKSLQDKINNLRTNINQLKDAKRQLTLKLESFEGVAR